MVVTKEYSGIQVTIKQEDLKKQGVIYLLEFPNGKVYIGQTIRKFNQRVKQHCMVDNKSPKLKNAIQKYKEFNVSILEENLTIWQLNSFEGYYIKLFNSNGEDGYNLDSGGNNRRSSDETKKKLSDIGKGKVKSDEHKRKLSDGNKGKHFKRVLSKPDNLMFESVNAAAAYYSVDRSTLGKLIKSGKISHKCLQCFTFAPED
jgi:hypothetical protein